MLAFMRTVAAGALLAGACMAAETRTWRHATQADFEKGSLKKLSLRSDGRLFLAPAFLEVFDAKVPYLWALAEDASGNLYAGGGGPGGSNAKLFQIDAAGVAKTLAELPGLEIHAIAIDSGGRVYAATSPDGKVYRVERDGAHVVFYDPKAKYIWAMAFNRRGELLVATGDRGEVHRVAANGQGAIFFQTEETHARALAIDASDNLIVGTEPGGVVLRVSPAGEGFVLYQTPKREVTAVAIRGDGAIYAAAAGIKQATPTVPDAPPATPLPPTPAVPGILVVGGRPTTAPPPPTLAGLGPTITGGSEIYRIDPDGYPRRVWNHGQEIVYAIAFDPAGRVVIGTGNRGNIYRLDSDVLSSLLVNASPTQVTGIFPGRQGRLYAVTGNIGKVFRIGPELEKQGTFESEALDAGFFTYWGRLQFKGSSAVGSVASETRSGNLDRPQKNWSGWSAVALNSTAGRIASPAARFLQYRLTLAASSDGRSPEIAAVEVAHLAKNVAPVIDEIESTPPNYRFPPQNLSLTPSTNLTLAPMGRGRRPAPSAVSMDAGSNSMQYASGHIGARWLARDENADDLTFKVEIRGARETEWKLLKDPVKEKHLSWDSTTFPDGEYRLRVTASDAPDNPPHQALSAVGEGELFLIDNTPPRIAGLTGTRAGTRLEARWRASDALAALKKAEYSVNGGEWLVVEPTTRLTDSPDHEYSLSVEAAPAGEVTLAVRVTDSHVNQVVEKVVVR